jgi:YVTN family beta-propeller protein
MTTKFLSLVSSVFVLVAVATSAAPKEYRKITEIPVGGEGGWDYLAVDEAGRRLYVSHGNVAVVIDLDSNKVVGEIADTPGIHGVAVAPKLGRVFTSNGRENKVSVVDAKTLKTLSKVETGENPDAILFEPSKFEVYAFNGRGKSATVIDGKSGKVVATIPLSGKPEFACADAKARRVYCNIEDKSEVAVIDTKSHTVKATWPIAPGEEPSGMAFDSAKYRLFLGCGNKMMVMLDSSSGKVLAHVPIGDGVDATKFDRKSGYTFSSCRDGTVTIAKEKGDALEVVQTLKTQQGSRTMALDTTTHRIYLAAAEFGEKKPGERRAPMKAGSFKVLVFGNE